MRLGRLAPGMRERGQVVVVFALLLPVFLGIGSVVVTIGNWYVHKKHLQSLVDAGAFAGATQFTGCFQDSVGTNNRVKLAALHYAGDPTRDTTTQNRQLEDPLDSHVVLNSSSYWPGAGTATDGTGYDWTNVSTAADAPKIGQAGAPCYNGYLDVKATEYKAPLLFKWLPAAPSPKSKARIEIREVAGVTGLLPVAVPEVLPDKVAALFVNSAGNIVGGANLNAASLPGLSEFSMYQGDVGGVALSPSGTYTIVIVSSRDSSFVAPTSGTLASVCTSNPVQTLCYGTPWSSTSNRAYSIWAYTGGTGSRNPPLLRQVELSGGCPTDKSAPYFNLDGGCSIAVSAHIEFNSGGGNPTAPASPICAQAWVNGNPMTWGAYAGDPFGRWTGTFTPSAGSGRNNVTITWETDQAAPACGGQHWSGSFGPTNAAYVGNTNSGPIQYLRATDNLTGLEAGSIDKTASASIHVTVGLLPPLIEAAALDPPIAMRFGSAAGSLNQALDCDKNVTFRDELLNNCQNPYISNKRNGSCAGYGTGNLPQPPVAPLPGDDCIVTETGDKSGQIRQAMNDRWGRGSGPTCQTANHWPTTAADLATYGMPDPLTDPRFVTIFVTDESAFGGSGNTIYPVRRFAGFYITAADGLNCTGAAVPAGGLNDYPANPGNKNMWGHFVSYVLPTSGGTPDTTLCKFSAGNVCVPVLTE